MASSYGDPGFFDENMVQELSKNWADAVIQAKRLGACDLDVVVQLMMLSASFAVEYDVSHEKFIQLAHSAYGQSLDIKEEEDDAEV